MKKYFRLELSEGLHTSIKAAAAIKGVTMHEYVVSSVRNQLEKEGVKKDEKYRD